MNFAAFQQYNDHEFDAEVFSKSLGDRLVRQHGLPFQIVAEKGDSADSSQHTGPLDWHVDGLYQEDTPKHVLLHCIDAGSEGTRTDFADTEAVRVSVRTRDVLSKLRSCYRSRDGNIYSRPFLAPGVINLTTRGWFEWLPDLDIREAPTLRQSTEAIAEYLAELDRIAIEHHWQQHDVVVFDNHRYVHRRCSKSLDQQRKITRMWFN